MKNFSRKMAALSVAVLLGQGAAHAESREGQWYIGAGVGVTELEPDVNQTTFSVAESRSSGFKAYIGKDLTG